MGSGAGQMNLNGGFGMAFPKRECECVRGRQKAITILLLSAQMSELPATFRPTVAYPSSSGSEGSVGEASTGFRSVSAAQRGARSAPRCSHEQIIFVHGYNGGRFWRRVPRLRRNEILCWLHRLNPLNQMSSDVQQLGKKSTAAHPKFKSPGK